MSELLTTREAAQLLRISTATFQRQHADKLPRAKVGKRVYRYRREDVEALFQAPSPPPKGSVVVPEAPGVYAIQAGEYVKVGRSMNILSRFREIQTCNPLPVQFLGVLSDDPREEWVFHAMLGRWRAHGEWFHLTPDVLRVIDDETRRTFGG